MNPRLLVCCGTRPELIKLKPLVERMREVASGAPVLLLHTGQHTDLVSATLANWKTSPMVRTEWARTGDRSRSLEVMINVIQGIIAQYPTLTHVVVQGDTDSTLASAVAASRSGLRLVHIEAGLRTHDLLDPFPEESNRTTVASLAHVHFAPTRTAAENLHREGVAPQQVLITGNTSIDSIVARMRSGSERLRDLVLVTLHRNGKGNGAADTLAEVLNDVLVDHPWLRVLWISHPNGIGRPDKWPTDPNFTFSAPLAHHALLERMERSAVVITDSGGVQEEATALGIPIVVYRRKHERPESMTSGTPAICTIDGPELRSFIAQYARHRRAPSHAFGDGHASQRIVDRLRADLGGMSFRTVIIGGGPAGTGPLFAAMKRNAVDGVLAGGLAILERTDNLVAGALPLYSVNSDTAASVFLECLSGSAGALLDVESMRSLTEPIASHGTCPIPLHALRPYLHELGRRLENHVRSVDGCMVAMGTTVTGLRQLAEGGWAVEIEGALAPTLAGKVVLATGASPKASVLRKRQGQFTFAGPLVCTSDELLRGRVDADIASKLTASPHICIVGASHSGFSAAWYILHRFGDRLSTQPCIRIIGETRPKIFFSNVEEALQAGYTDHEAGDVCPVTGRLFRLAGLRMDGRELYMRMIGLKTPVERRVEFVTMPRNGHDQLMQNADVVVDATGYRPIGIEIRDTQGESIQFHGDRTGHWVDERCRVLNEKGLPVEGLYAAGLATGFIPSGDLGGEANFTGQTNGLWYYQNIIGDILCAEITDEVPSHLP